LRAAIIAGEGNGTDPSVAIDDGGPLRQIKAAAVLGDGLFKGIFKLKMLLGRVAGQPAATIATVVVVVVVGKGRDADQCRGCYQYNTREFCHGTSSLDCRTQFIASCSRNSAGKYYRKSA
jgi:hypothetical protein